MILLENVLNPVVFEKVLLGFNFELQLFGLFTLFAALTVYPLYIIAMLRREQAPPRSTWFLWVILDIVAFSASLGRGNFDVMLFAYTVGSLVVALFTIKYGSRGWTKTETICTIVVAITIGIWAIAGPLIGTICAMSGFFVATFPLLKRVWRGEYEDLRAWCILIVSTILNMMDGQILTSSCFVVLQLSVVLPVFYYWKYLPRKKAQLI